MVAMNVATYTTLNTTRYYAYKENTMDFNKLLNHFDSISTPTKKSYDNDAGEYWKLQGDKAGNGSAVIRFLPNNPQDEIPFVRIFNHGFKNKANNRWYIENSLSTIGLPDPLGERNAADWNTGIEAMKEQVRLRKRKLSYVSNILVIKDPANTDNEGKIFKFRFGKKIMEKIMAVAKPDTDLDPDAQPINAFDPFEGANFSLKMVRVSDFPNYDQSQFASKKALFNGDQKKIDAVLEKCFDLNALIAPDQFKSYDELAKKLKWVLGEESAPVNSGNTTADDEDEFDSLSKIESAPRQTKSTPMVTKVDDDDDEALFKSLVED